jgi:GNAT superfamily N-acetyltransferase
MVAFRDKAGRDIRIEVDGDCAYAYHDGKKVGDLITTGRREIDERSPDIPAEIAGWEVDKAYRGAGIATEMVSQLVEEIGTLLPGKRDRGIGGENALTDDGLHITLKCQELGLIYPFPDDVDPTSERI